MPAHFTASTFSREMIFGRVLSVSRSAFFFSWQYYWSIFLSASTGIMLLIYCQLVLTTPSTIYGPALAWVCLRFRSNPFSEMTFQCNMVDLNAFCLFFLLVFIVRVFWHTRFSRFVAILLSVGFLSPLAGSFSFGHVETAPDVTPQCHHSAPFRIHVDLPRLSNPR